MASTFTRGRSLKHLRALRNSNAAAIEDALSPKNVVPADQFPKFLQLPAELRIYVWEQAFLEEEFLFRALFAFGSIQRFRFDLRWDPDRVKPGKDESRGWVACFTPLSINTRPHLKFLRVCYESRKYMMQKGGMSILTVHGLQHDEKGDPVGSPRKCHMPYHFGRDIFCVEGISHGVERGLRFELNRAKDKKCVGGPRTLPELLENALGLRFAPRIKRLAIIPHYQDITQWEHGFVDRLSTPFEWMTRGRHMAVLAKRFPSLVSVKSAIAQAGYSRREDELGISPGYFQWYGADLRGHGQGGPTRMSEAVRDTLYRMAWRRLFDVPFETCRSRIKAELWKGCVCLVRRSKSQVSMVDGF